MGVGPGHRHPAGASFTGHTRNVTAVAMAELDARSVVISGSDDQTVWAWGLAADTPAGAPFTGYTRRVVTKALQTAAAAVRSGERVLCGAHSAPRCR